MENYVTYKYRLYPNKSLQQTFEKYFCAIRFVYNHYLELLKKQKNQDLNLEACLKDLKLLIKQEKILQEVESNVLENSLRGLFKNIKSSFKQNNETLIYKNQYQKQSFKINIHEVEIFDNHLFIAKFSPIKIVYSQVMRGRVLSATIMKTKTNKYYVAFLVKKQTKTLKKTKQVVGIDLGIKNYVTLSNGIKLGDAKYLNDAEFKLDKELKKLNRKIALAKQANRDYQFGSNYQKQQVKVNRLYEKLKNKREDYLQQLSSYLVNTYDVICVESLAIEQLKQNNQRAKIISDLAWNDFVDKLDYKCKWYGKKLIKVHRYYPSSQICSRCQNKVSKLDLSIRKFKCPSCKLEIDRDLNASINILNEGLKQINK